MLFARWVEHFEGKGNDQMDSMWRWRGVGSLVEYRSSG